MKKKNNSSPKYYVYYDKRTGEIFSISNERNSNYEHELITTYDQVEKFLNDEWKFRDFLVAYKRSVDDQTDLSIIPKADDQYAFRNNIYEWITPSTKPPELIVEWNKPAQLWNFYLGNKAKESYNNGILTAKLTFFVTLEHDFDFLIKTIKIDMQELMSQKKISVPFSSTFEKDINKISIGTRLVFKKYGLKIVNE